ncbi:MAG TPA: hypothetical protein VGF17_15980, partial [Phytomonospora sp.]
MPQGMWRRLAVSATATVALTGVWTAPARAAETLRVDRQVVAHQDTPAPAITSPGLSTTAGDALLVAFVSSDGPSAGGASGFASVTGGGLDWTMRVRANTRAGVTEIWQAVAPDPLSGVAVTATRAGGSYAGSLVVTAFAGADTTAGGAVASASAASGAPSVSLTATRTGSWVWGAGNDWDSASSRTVGSGQTKVDEFLASVGDTFWVQRRASADSVAGAVTRL